MNILNEIESEWLWCFQSMANGEFFKRLAMREFGLEHYKAFLAEEFFNTTENPKIMARFVSRMEIRAPKISAKLLKHAAMEMGHNEMALSDFKNLGGDDEKIRSQRPLPTTEAIAAFITFEIEHRNPLAFLGYIYHMEKISVQLAGNSGALFKEMNIPDQAQTFLNEHADADPTHLKWNREYMEELVRTPEELAAVLYGMKGTCILHGIRFQGIIDSVERRGFFQN